MKLSIAMPAYNEEARLENTLKKYLNYDFSYPIEILVVLNGCTDDSLNIVKKLAKKYNKLKYIELKEPSKGQAILTGLKKAKGDLVCYVDTDYSTTVGELARLVKKLDGYDAVIGSRWVAGAKIKVKQPILRRIASRCFNFLVRTILGLKFKDTQAGIKIFRKDSLDVIINKLVANKWAFDVSILYYLNKEGFKIREVPTEWEDKKGSKLKMYKAIPNMLWAILRLKFSN